MYSALLDGRRAAEEVCHQVEPVVHLSVRAQGEPSRHRRCMGSPSLRAFASAGVLADLALDRVRLLALQGDEQGERLQEAGGPCVREQGPLL